MSPMASLTVGFDLDMTLIDSRPGIRACYVALAERTGTYIDADLAITRLGPPLADELVNWFRPSGSPRSPICTGRCTRP